MKQIKINLEQLLLSNSYLGDNSGFLNEKLKPYLLGYKNGFHILNISFTLWQLKLLVNIIFNIVSLRQKILIVKELDFFQFNKILNIPNVFYYDKKWIGGILTNFRIVSKGEKFLNANSSSNKLVSMRCLPSLVFLLDINLSRWALIEASNLEIPISAIVNSSSTNFDIVNYPVIGNNKSFESVYLYLNIIKNAVLKGRQKECLNILRIL